MKILIKLFYWGSNVILSLPILIYLFMVFGCVNNGEINLIGENCCTAIRNTGNIIGLGYYATNILLFCIAEPLLIITGFLLFLARKYTNSWLLDFIAYSVITGAIILGDFVILQDPTMTYFD